MDSKYFWVLLAWVFVYLLAGGAVFQKLEEQNEEDAQVAVSDKIVQFLDDHPSVNDSALIDFLKIIIKNCNVMERILRDDVDSSWGFLQSLCFCASVLTTIGYGHRAPGTSMGRIVCVFYALFGIPLMVLLLDELSKKLQGLYIVMEAVNFCRGRPRANRLLSCFLVISLGVLLMFIVPAAVFSRAEGWSFVEGVYFCFITLSTIGFGDYLVGIRTPGKHTVWWIDIYKIGMFVWMLFGLAYLALIIKSLMLFIDECIHPGFMATRVDIEREIEELEATIKMKRQSLQENQARFDAAENGSSGEKIPLCTPCFLLERRRRRLEFKSTNQQTPSLTEDSQAGGVYWERRRPVDVIGNGDCGHPC